jgi:hypothetical protein
MTPEELAKLTPEALADVQRKLLLDSITNALDAIMLVDEVSLGMDPADVRAAIATAIVRSGLVPKTAISRAWLRYADAPTVTH